MLNLLSSFCHSGNFFEKKSDLVKKTQKIISLFLLELPVAFTTLWGHPYVGPSLIRIGLTYLSNIGEDGYPLVPAAEIRDYETGLVSEPFSRFQSRHIFPETHETEANHISFYVINFSSTSCELYNFISFFSRLRFCIKQTIQSKTTL